ncbi:MAG: aldo/keto reductase, partial [Candidatus Polarisedimenticolia bacterium]
ERLPVRPPGRTGHRATLFALGGQALLEQEGSKIRDRAVALIHRALDLGVNYCDTAPLYGPSQDYFGEVMTTRRRETFLASKTADRSRDGSLRLLEDSLKRLRTDRIDLWQLHHIGSREDLERAFRKGGAIEALQRARDEGTVRFLGITGHYDPATLLEGIRRFEFDCILMALNAADRHHLPFQEDLLKAAAAKKMGIIGMKVPARGKLLDRPGLAMKDCVDYVWSLPVSTIIIGCDSIPQLEENAALARAFRPLDADRMAALEARTRPEALRCSWYKRGSVDPWG